MRITVQEVILSDNSSVWNVNVDGAVFHCVTESDAALFVDKLSRLIDSHTCDYYTVHYPGPVQG